MVTTTQRLLVACLAAMLVLATACGSDSERPSTKESPAVTDRPAMETMVKRYEALQADLFASLEAKLGPRGWAVSANSLGGGRSGCEDDPEGERVQLPPMSFDGTYDAAAWDEVKALVEQVGRTHGFDDVATVKDEPGDLLVVGEDEFGGRYEFGMARNTIFDVRTGCHRWDQKPSPSP